MKKGFIKTFRNCEHVSRDFLNKDVRSVACSVSDLGATLSVTVGTNVRFRMSVGNAKEQLNEPGLTGIHNHYIWVNSDTCEFLEDILESINMCKSEFCCFVYHMEQFMEKKFNFRVNNVESQNCLYCYAKEHKRC